MIKFKYIFFKLIDLIEIKGFGWVFKGSRRILCERRKRPADTIFDFRPVDGVLPGHGSDADAIFWIVQLFAEVAQHGQEVYSAFDEGQQGSDARQVHDGRDVVDVVGFLVDFQEFLREDVAAECHRRWIVDQSLDPFAPVRIGSAL